ncbi:MAG: ABC transporter permease [Chitinophagales bacterium]
MPHHIVLTLFSYVRPVAILFKIFVQAFRLSFEELRASKLRSVLSLTGITIGILCVITVRTAVVSLEKNIRDSFDTFGGDVLYVQKWPLIFTENYPWWRFFNRPKVTDKDMKLLQDRVPDAAAVAMVSFNSAKAAKYGNQSVEQVTLTGITYEYNVIKDMEMVQGRYFTPSEANYPTFVCIIGSDIAAALFPNKSTIAGEEIRLDGVKLKVIGVLKKEGNNIIGWTLDNMVIIPHSVLSTFVKTDMGGGDDPMITLKPKPGITAEELKYEVIGAMRGIRRLSPKEDDDFAVNQMSAITDGLSSFFDLLSLGGLIIGMFSIIVGGFGIANIMFVSVKERTNLIGIKKALGARQIYILLEFLLEAVMLCLIGGMLGVLLVVGLTSLANYIFKDVMESSFTFYLTSGNVILGLSISIIIGILAGFIPAFIASRMRPVDAIRS